MISPTIDEYRNVMGAWSRNLADNLEQIDAKFDRACATDQWRNMMKTTIFLALLVFATPAAAERTFESENGAKFHILGNAQSMGSLGRFVTVYDDDGRPLELVFDCRGRVGTLSGPGRGTWHSIPSRSVEAAISQFACK
jgi:hypothetical protein